MLKKINQLLKLVGLNLVRAKRPKKAGYRSHDAKTGGSCVHSPTSRVDEFNAGNDQPTACEIKASQPASDNNITGPTS